MENIIIAKTGNTEVHVRLDSPRPEIVIPSPEPQGHSSAFAGAGGCPDPRCPQTIATALLETGWSYHGMSLGWTNSGGVPYYMLWETAVAEMIRACAGQDNPATETRRE